MSNDNNMVNLIKAATIMRRHHTISADTDPDLLEALKAFDALPEYYKASTWDEACKRAREPKEGLT